MKKNAFLLTEASIFKALHNISKTNSNNKHQSIKSRVKATDLTPQTGRQTIHFMLLTQSINRVDILRARKNHPLRRICRMYPKILAAGLSILMFEV